MRSGEKITIMQMQPPKHYQKITKHLKDNKYYDLRKE